MQALHLCFSVVPSAHVMFDESSSPETRSRGKIVRDLLVFQVKLWLEGFKDIALVPLSLGAAVIDLIFLRKSSRGALYRVMDLGDRFENWVDLYGARPGKGEPVDTTRYAERYPFRDVSSSDVDSAAPDAVPESSSSSSRRRKTG